MNILIDECLTRYLKSVLVTKGLSLCELELSREMDQLKADFAILKAENVTLRTPYLDNLICMLVIV